MREFKLIGIVSSVQPRTILERTVESRARFYVSCESNIESTRCISLYHEHINFIEICFLREHSYAYLRQLSKRTLIDDDSG